MKERQARFLLIIRVFSARFDGPSGRNQQLVGSGVLFPNLFCCKTASCAASYFGHFTPAASPIRGLPFAVPRLVM